MWTFYFYEYFTEVLSVVFISFYKILIKNLIIIIIIIIVYIPGFLKTGLAKISTNSTSWQFKTRKLVQRPIKSVYMTPGSKLMVPRSIPTSPNLK